MSVPLAGARVPRDPIMAAGAAQIQALPFANLRHAHADIEQKRAVDPLPEKARFARARAPVPEGGLRRLARGCPDDALRLRELEHLVVVNVVHEMHVTHM